jgi:hypothetical protein
MNIKQLLTSISLLLISSQLLANEDPSPGKEPVKYDTHIKPIFEKHCMKCHEGWFPDAGLR